MTRTQSRSAWSWAGSWGHETFSGKPPLGKSRRCHRWCQKPGTSTINHLQQQMETTRTLFSIRAPSKVVSMRAVGRWGSDGMPSYKILASASGNSKAMSSREHSTQMPTSKGEGQWQFATNVSGGVHWPCLPQGLTCIYVFFYVDAKLCLPQSFSCCCLVVFIRFCVDFFFFLFKIRSADHQHRID